MKTKAKWMGIVPVIAMTGILTGCGNQKTVDAASAPTTTQAVASNPNASAAVKAQAAQQDEIGKRQQQLMQQAAKANAARK